MGGKTAVMMLLAAVAAVSGCADDRPQQLERKTVMVGSEKVSVQIADDDGERSKGLMFVKAMPEGDGMLFVWPEAAERSFWMKNTYIPLDLMFIRDGKVVHIAAQAKPFDETGLPSGEPADMVLEVNGGWAQRHGVAVGTKVTF